MKKEVSSALDNLDEKGFLAKKIFEEEYNYYVSNISSPDMAVSLETASMMKVLVDELKPEKILDLGSGFSSFLFRSLLSDNYQPKIVSVDDNEFWLEKTKIYLSAKGLNTENLYTWSEFEATNQERYDFIFHDLGSMETRKQALPFTVKYLSKEHGILILDDVHKVHYYDFAVDALKDHQLKVIDVKENTLDKFGRYSCLVYK